MLTNVWGRIADKVVAGFGVESDELIQVRDRAGRRDVLEEFLLAVESAGAMPLPEITSPQYMKRMLRKAPREYLADWDSRRRHWMHQTDRIIVLQGADLEVARGDELSLWAKSASRLTALEESIGPLPFYLVAIPTEERAARLDVSLGDLEAKLLPALRTDVKELRPLLAKALAKLSGGRSLILQSGSNGQYTLNLRLGDRKWLYDDGELAPESERSGIVLNLPAGSVYTTVVEEDTEGELYLPRANDATKVVMSFEAGRVCDIKAASGEEELQRFFDSHTGEPRRIGHIGFGLNPYLEEPVNWTLVDENMQGSVFISFGENGYMGGLNESSLNVDFLLLDATLKVDNKTLIEQGIVL